MRRRRLAARDVLVAILVVLFAWLGLQVHHAIADLADTARGVRATGTTIRTTGRAAGGDIRRGFEQAAGTAGRAPLVGDDAARALRDAGARTAGAVERQARRSGGELERTGAQAERDIMRMARLAGWLTFLVPTLLLLSQTVPPRARARRPAVR